MTEPKTERADGGPDTYQCDSCAKVWTYEQLHDIPGYFERVSPGNEAPAGECPDSSCGALCYPVVELSTALAARQLQADAAPMTHGEVRAWLQYASDAFTLSDRQAARIGTIGQLQADEAPPAAGAATALAHLKTLQHKLLASDVSTSEEDEALATAIRVLTVHSA